MTSDRTQAYGRIVKTLEDVGPAKLQPAEEERIREAADTLIFAADLDEARPALADVEALAAHLVSSDRWTAERADELDSRPRGLRPGRPCRLAGFRLRLLAPATAGGTAMTRREEITRRDALRQMSSLALLCSVGGVTAASQSPRTVTSAALRARDQRRSARFAPSCPSSPSCARRAAHARATSTTSRSAMGRQRSCAATRRRSSATTAATRAPRSAPAAVARSSSASATRSPCRATCTCTAAPCPRRTTGTRWT